MRLFQGSPLTFRPLPAIVFLCGSSDRTRRRLVEDHLKQSNPSRLVVYAEDAWGHVVQMTPHPPLKLMDMERQLAEVADVILIIFEGEGAIHELGAFNENSEWRRKLLVMFDESHRNSGSFIDTGVIRDLNRSSRISPVLFCDFMDVLRSSQELDARLESLDDSVPKRVKDLRLSDKQALFLLCDLLAIIGPAPIEHCKAYMSEILHDPPWSVETLLSLGVVCDLLKATAAEGPSLYSRPLFEEEHAYLMRSNKPLSLASHRAEVLGAMARIPSTPHQLQLAKR